MMSLRMSYQGGTAGQFRGTACTGRILLREENKKRGTRGIFSDRAMFARRMVFDIKFS